MTLALLALLLAQHVLPDPKLTPGATDPRVTQANIRQTICVSGYTNTVRPPVSYTNRIKLKQMRARGITGPLSAWKLDHRIPLDAAGNPRDERNLYLESAAEANLKDRLERAVGGPHGDICSGRLTLRQGQAIFAGDYWIEYERRYGKAGMKQ